MKSVPWAMLVVLVGLPGLAQDPKLNGLQPYAGKDLRKFEEPATGEFRRQVEALTGDKPEKSSYEPWWVKQFDAGKETWIFLEAYPGYDIPDMSGVQVHVFDNNWKRRCKQSFPTGYRCFLNEVAIIEDESLNQDLLVAKVASSGPFIVQGDGKRPLFEQGDYQLQYYALMGDHFVMIRLEDNRKRLAQNHYRWRVPSKGPRVPMRTREEWIRSLSSENAVDQLATLVWLSGIHLSSAEARYENVTQESVEDSKLFEAVRDAVETKSALRKLTTSNTSWVQEYATLTLQLINE